MADAEASKQQVQFDSEELNKPITERSNPLSKNVDTASSLGIVDTLHACEKEIFSGWGNYQSLFDDNILRTAGEVSAHVTRILKHPSDGAIVLSGCGTSGRLAFLTAVKMNGLLEQMGLPPCFDYIIAGGYRALTHAVEACEDSPEAGRNSLMKAAEGKRHVLFVGITCGLSAPFVAGQLNYCMSHLDVFTPVLLGFNPSHLARDQPIEGWEQTFLSVTRHLEGLQKKGKAFILNPVVGPEPVTGSTRMKSGGATKLLLEACFLTALASAIPPPIPTTSTSCQGDVSGVHGNHDVTKEEGEAVGQTTTGSCNHRVSEAQVTLIRTLLSAHRPSWEESYRSGKDEVARLIELAGTSLNAGGHVYYIGWDVLGVLGLIDASECPTTFGTAFNDVRGFFVGGLSQLASTKSMSKVSMNCNTEDETSIGFFKKTIMPSISLSDTVIFLLPKHDSDSWQEAKSLLQQIMKKTQQIGIVSTTIGALEQLGIKDLPHVRIRQPDRQIITGLVEVGLPLSLEGAVCDCLAEFSTKSALNAISTGAHIRRGKVFHNYMIDLQLTNAKLFKRGVEMVARISGCSHDNARNAVFRSIYRTDEVSNLSDDIPVSSIVEKAAIVEKVFPIAIILVLRKCTVKDALVLQEREPAIRTAFAHLLQKQ